MKKLSRFFLLLSFTMAVGVTACKKKANDADTKTAIEAALKADPMAEGTMVVSVEKGVATIGGTAKDDAAKTHCTDLVKGIKNVKEVVNNATVAPPPAPVQITADDPLAKAVTDAIKDFPGVMASVKDGIITLTGEISRDKLQKLMMGLQALHPKKVVSTELVKK